MPKDIQERMRALIAQHGSALVALTALQQHLKAQQMTSKLILWKILFHILMFQ
jgi:ferric iron reductase protein FhuF